MVKIRFEALHPTLCRVGKKPAPAMVSQPQWWKDIPHYFSSHGTTPENRFHHKSVATIRNCPAVSDSIEFGYTMFSQFDFFLDASNPDNLAWNSPDIQVDALQFSGFPLVMSPFTDNHKGFLPPMGYHDSTLKISTLWSAKTPPGYSMWITAPMHQHNLPVRVIDAIVDSDKMPLTFPMAFWVKSGYVGTIKAGMPLVQVIPFKRDDFEAEYGEVDIQELKDIEDISRSRFTNAYKRLQWKRKKFK